MKYQDPLDESREHWVDGQIDQATDIERTLHQKGRLLKERCARELDRYEGKIIQRDLRVDSEAG